MRTRFEKRTHPGSYVFIALSTFTVFVVDLQTIVGVATWLFYLVPLGACLFVTRPAVPLQVALIATALIFADYVYFGARNRCLDRATQPRLRRRGPVGVRGPGPAGWSGHG